MPGPPHSLAFASDAESPPCKRLCTAAGGRAQEDGRTDSAPSSAEAPAALASLVNVRLSSGAFALRLLQHVLRKRLRLACAGRLHPLSADTAEAATPGAAEGRREASSPREKKTDTAALRLASTQGRASSRATSLSAVSAALASKLRCCLELKEKSSVLLLGPRGSGKTAAVEAALSFVQKFCRRRSASAGEGQAQGALPEPLVVRVNCSLFSGDFGVLQAIVRRLCATLREREGAAPANPTAFSLEGNSFEGWLQRLRAILRDACSVLGCAVIVVLDRIEVCCVDTPFQSLLYALFDLQHGEGLHICTVALSSVLEITDSMEKRIRSRFSMQKLCLAHPQDPEALVQFIQTKILQVTVDDLLAARGKVAEETEASREADREALRVFLETYSRAWRQRLEASCFVSHVARQLAMGAHPRGFFYAAVSPFLELSPPLPAPWLEEFSPQDSSTASLRGPAFPEALSPLGRGLRQGREEEASAKNSPQRNSSPTGSPNRSPRRVLDAADENSQQQKILSRLRGAFALREAPRGGEEEGLADEAVSLSALPNSSALESLCLASLSFSEHLVLAAMTRLHRRQALPKTFALVLQEVASYFKAFNPLRRSASQASLRRSYARLLEAGVLKPCAYRVNHLGISAVAHDLLGTFVPCKFPAHEKFYSSIAEGCLPDDVLQWLRSSSCAL